MTANGRFVGFCALILGSSWATLATAQLTIVAGTGDGPPTEFVVPYSPSDSIFGSWNLDANLIFEPTAPGMIKSFGAPRFLRGDRIQLIGSQPIVFPINENFFLPSTAPTAPITDWHEVILTPGWIWVLPGTPGLPTEISLITRDGENWPWSPIDPGNTNPQVISVIFQAIEAGHVLDIHKGLLWVGTPDNPIWGDSADELAILVREYPTPEPASWMLAAFGMTTLACWRWRRARRRAAA